MSNEQQDRRRLGDRRVDELVDEVKELRRMVEETNKNVEGIVDAWQAVEGGIKVLGAIGKVLKFVAVVGGVVTALSAAWYSLTHWGEHPIGGK